MVLPRDDRLRESILRRGRHSSVASDNPVPPVTVSVACLLTHVVDQEIEVSRR